MESVKSYVHTISVRDCVIYTMIKNRICIDCVSSKKTKLSDLRLGVSGSYKHLGGKYDNILGFGIPYLLLNLLSCQGFLTNKYYVVILKLPNRIFECYFNQVFIFLFSIKTI